MSPTPWHVELVAAVENCELFDIIDSDGARVVTGFSLRECERIVGLVNNNPMGLPTSGPSNK